MSYVREERRLIDALSKFRQTMEKEVEKRREAINKAPEGSLRISRNGRGNINYYNYEETSKKDIYIRKKEMDKAILLAQKDYDIKELEIIDKQLKLAKELQKSMLEGKVMELYNELSDIRKGLVCPIDITDEEYIKKWESYTSNLKNTYEIYGDYYTMKGEHVRSKSEKIIADSLYAHKVPYKYEEGMMLATGEVVFPDFIALNARTRKEYLLEHMGKMGDMGYTTEALRKLDKYAINGYWPGDNLLLTFEGGEKSINSLIVDKMIEKFLV